jgi:hypothetical protein
MWPQVYSSMIFTKGTHTHTTTQTKIHNFLLIAPKLPLSLYHPTLHDANYYGWLYVYKFLLPVSKLYLKKLDSMNSHICMNSCIWFLLLNIVSGKFPHIGLSSSSLLLLSLVYSVLLWKFTQFILLLMDVWNVAH